MPANNLTLEEVQDYYGHSYLEKDIKSLYPYDDADFHKERYSSEGYTITYDPYTAIKLRMKKYPVVIWGQKYKNNHRAFVFVKSRPEALCF